MTSVFHRFSIAGWFVVALATAARARADDDERAAALVTPASAPGLDPQLVEYATFVARETATARGFRIVADDVRDRALERASASGTLDAATLWRATWVARAEYGIAVRIAASGEAYSIDVTVAAADGTGPFTAHDVSTPAQFNATVERLVRLTLPRPPPVSVAPLYARLVPRREPRAAPITPPSSRSARPLSRRFVAVVETHAAIGTANDGSYNHAVGVRLDYRFSDQARLGAYVGYVNLQGRNGRVDNTLFLAMFENRIPISSRSDVTIPFRLFAGYLPFNGPVFRIGAGVAVPMTAELELNFELLAPSFWILDRGVLVTFDAGLEVGWRF